MTQPYLIVNNKTLFLKDTSPNSTLLEYLRQSGFVGTKEGCGDGDCGACTVAIIAQNQDRKPYYQAMNSCIVPLGAVIGREIITVEGIAGDTLHPVQQAMVETGGSQCGYCTPGFIMSMFCAYYQGTVNDVCIEGNLCRCTGYLPIRRAAQKVTGATRIQDRFTQKLEQASTRITECEYGEEGDRFHRPINLNQLLQLLQQHPNATLIAGATDIGLHLSHHTQHFPLLISLEAIPELQTLYITPESVEIGAALPLSHIQTHLQGIFPSLDTMLSWFAARQIRNRATIGGNLGTASPIGDLSPVLLSLDATVSLTSPQGERTLSLCNFFQNYRQTALQAGEIIRSISIPRILPPKAIRRLSQSYKVGKRGTDDISIVAAAFTIDLDENHHIIQTRLAYGGVAPIPIRATQVEEMLIGKPWHLDTIRDIKPILQQTFSPLTDLRASSEYRQLLVANLFEKFFHQMGE
ncbi:MULTISPECIES: xanthine dehydrogenase small subunit [unclassified Roseofilum]|uniref:xanthine dehydrogenase small subunit n=1 Tax=unclassified Roseofilum TaxID=2620099 RepID=UPI000E94F9FD|nr:MULTISPECIES: xanthine dehydrogenase small subunit [unclassified Roseofilum]MBP0010029.1 xanthine dehydrogenase small subunit [Roseofilum sp. Belize Diploria]MBP0034263.1 xanthine dehydrogenase small subunit [Roseofilum sp. Belize BBD 4]HBQ98243.1 xanthine dehydrogenase small subunit [Cyanobacteria bacterium UBA11691]